MPTVTTVFRKDKITKKDLDQFISGFVQTQETKIYNLKFR